MNASTNLTPQAERKTEEIDRGKSNISIGKHCVNEPYKCFIVTLT